jgi:hypothetical protein
LKWPYNHLQHLASLPYDEVAAQLLEETSEADTLTDEETARKESDDEQT